MCTLLKLTLSFNFIYYAEGALAKFREYIIVLQFTWPTLCFFIHFEFNIANNLIINTKVYLQLKIN